MIDILGIRCNEPSMVFDWDKAAMLINKHQPASAGAGLAGDWNHTCGEIYRDGKPLPREEIWAYLSSNWATPQIEMDGWQTDCYRIGEETIDWPESALAILEGCCK